MKYCLIFMILLSSVCKGQEWQAELMAGAAGYNGDLTEKRIMVAELKPAVSLNFKYVSGDFINFRAGLSYAILGADDNKNPSPGLQSRNLSFKTNILEVNAIMEVVLFDPEVYTAYPYIFGGIGVFHFNPYTFDNSNKKVFLQPLATEGEGLKEYPGRKKYSLTQACFPVGAGWKWALNDKWDISFEMGVRILYTDYLDDVSKGYVDLNVLATEKGQEAADLSYRGSTPLIPENVRGNPSIKDVYFFTGIKIATSLRNLFSRR